MIGMCLLCYIFIVEKIKRILITFTVYIQLIVIAYCISLASETMLEQCLQNHTYKQNNLENKYPCGV